MPLPRLTAFGNQKGLALVYIAILLVLPAFVLAVVVDMGYYFVARNQLHKDADAASLAGAKVMRPPDPPPREPRRSVRPP